MEPSSNEALKASVLLQSTVKTRDLTVQTQEREDRSEIALFLVMRVRGAATWSSTPTCNISGCIALPPPPPVFCFSAKGIFWKPTFPK